MSFRKSTILTYIDSIVAAAVSFFTALILINYHGQEFYGIWLYIQSIASVLLLIITVGTTSIFKRDTASGKISIDSAISYLVFGKLLFVPLITLIGILLKIDLYILGYFIIIGTFFQASSLFLSIDKTRLQLYYNGILRISVIAVISILSLKYMSISLFGLSSVLFGIIFLRYFKESVKIKELYKYWALGFPLLLANSAEFLLLKSDQILLGWFKFNEDLALYGVLMQVVLLFVMLPLAAYKVVLVAIRKEPTKFLYYKEKCFKYISYYAIGSCILLLVFFRYLVHIIFSFDTLDWYRILLLVLLFVLLILNRMWNYFNLALELDSAISASFGLGFILNAILNVMLIPKLGMDAALLSSIMCEFLMLLLLRRSLNRYLLWR